MKTQWAICIKDIFVWFASSSVNIIVMISIENEISRRIMNESASKQHHLFKDEKTTFRQLKDILSDTLGDHIVKMSRKVPMVDLYLT